MEVSIGSLLLLGGIMFILAAVGWVIYRAVKGDSNIGSLILQGLVNQHLVLLILLLICAGLSEASIISSNPLEGEESVKAFTRIGAHLTFVSISFLMLLQIWFFLADAIALTPPLNSNKRKKHLAALKKKGITSFKIVASWIIVISYLIIGFGLPLINLYMLALAIGMDRQLFLFLYEFKAAILPDFLCDPSEIYFQTVKVIEFTKTSLSPDSYVVKDGIAYLPPDYNPWKDMNYSLHLMSLTVGVAIALSLIKGLIMYVRGTEFKGILTGANKEVEKDAAAKKAAEKKKSFLTPLNKILINYGYDATVEATKITDIITVCNEIFDKATDAKRAQYTSKINDLVTRYEAFTAADIAEKEVWITDVHSFFSKPPSSGVGFGRTLKRV